MHRLLAVLGILVLVGCAPAQPNVVQVSVVNAGQGGNNPSPAVQHDWQISFAGDKAINGRRFETLSDRTVEQMTLLNNSVVRYAKMKEGVFPGDYSDAEALRFDMDVPFFRDKKVAYDPAKVKTSGAFTYILASSDSFNCFLMHVNFGKGGGRGDEQVTSNYCSLKTNHSMESIEHEMLDYMARLRLSGDPIHKG